MGEGLNTPQIISTRTGKVVWPGGCTTSMDCDERRRRCMRTYRSHISRRRCMAAVSAIRRSTARCAFHFSLLPLSSPLYFFLGPLRGVPMSEAAPRSLTPTTRSILASSCWFGTARPLSRSAIWQSAVAHNVQRKRGEHVGCRRDDGQIQQE